MNSIWEGSGNVICLDVLRALYKDPGALPAFFAEVERAKGGNRNLDLHITRLKAEVDEQGNFEARARRITEMMALAWQAALLVQHAPSAVSETGWRFAVINIAMSVIGNCLWVVLSVKYSVSEITSCGGLLRYG